MYTLQYKRVYGPLVTVFQSNSVSKVDGGFDALLFAVQNGVIDKQDVDYIVIYNSFGQQYRRIEL